MQLSPLSFSAGTAVFMTAVLATVGFTAPPRVAPVEAVAAPVEPQVDVIERADWGASAGRGTSIGPVDDVIVHHFWRPNLPSVVAPEREAALMRAVEKTHVEDNEWSGFGYSFVVFQSGRVYEGRGWGREGAHTVGMNDRSIGIAFAIDGDEHVPTPEAWAAAKDLIEDGVALGHIEPDLEISGHRDHAAKSCPGERIAPHIQSLRPSNA